MPVSGGAHDPASGRVAVNVCPYCGEEELRPQPEPRGAWRCAGCTRVFVVTFVGLAPPA